MVLGRGQSIGREGEHRHGVRERAKCSQGGREGEHSHGVRERAKCSQGVRV